MSPTHFNTQTRDIVGAWNNAITGIRHLPLDLRVHLAVEIASHIATDDLLEVAESLTSLARIEANDDLIAYYTATAELLVEMKANR